MSKKRKFRSMEEVEREFLPESSMTEEERTKRTAERIVADAFKDFRSKLPKHLRA